MIKNCWLFWLLYVRNSRLSRKTGLPGNCFPFFPAGWGCCLPPLSHLLALTSPQVTPSCQLTTECQTSAGLPQATPSSSSTSLTSRTKIWRIGWAPQRTDGALIRTLLTSALDLQCSSALLRTPPLSMMQQKGFSLCRINIFKLNFRLIATLKERISMTHQEDTLQEILSMTFEERSRVKARRGDHLCKASLENILPP